MADASEISSGSLFMNGRVIPSNVKELLQSFAPEASSVLWPEYEHCYAPRGYWGQAAGACAWCGLYEAYWQWSSDSWDHVAYDGRNPYEHGRFYTEMVYLLFMYNGSYLFSFSSQCCSNACSDLHSEHVRRLEAHDSSPGS